MIYCRERGPEEWATKCHSAPIRDSTEGGYSFLYVDGRSQLSTGS